MKRKIITAISLLVVIGNPSCKKCYECINSCCIYNPTQQLICNTDYNSSQEYSNVLDSLSSDVTCSMSNAISIHKEACSEEEKEYFENIEGLGCIIIDK